MPLISDFLVVYDYGMGGVWGIAEAESSSEIVGAFPELRVVEERPAWLDDARMARIQENSKFRVGDERTYPEWLRTLIRNRSGSTA